MTLDILRYNPRPGISTANVARAGTGQVYWKTGTSIGFRDAWAVGIFDDYVLAVWIGDFRGDSNPAFVGRGAAGPLFFQIAEALRGRPDHRLSTPPGHVPPPGVRRVRVCSVSGALPRAICPGTRETWYVPGLSPLRRCDVHREVLIDAATGLRLCGPPRRGMRVEVFEFWPGDLRELFRKAGIHHREPPPFAPHCRLEQRAAVRGVSPVITSPLANVTYTVRLENGGRNSIALSAVADGDVRRLFWFANTDFLGESAPDRPLMWEMRVGRFMLRVVDDRGRSDSRELEVEGI